MVEPLTLLGLRGRIGDVFREGYLTVLAIIQGVALGVLLSTTQAEWLDHSEALGHIRVAAQAMAVFGMIVVVTHRYILLTVLGRWIPTTFDTLIPYTLGSGEIAASLLVGHNVAWWESIAVFSFAAIASYVHSRVRNIYAGFGEVGELSVRFRAVTGRAIIALSCLAIVSISIAVLGSYMVGPAWFYSVSPILPIVTLMGIVVTGNYRISSLR